MFGWLNPLFITGKSPSFTGEIAILDPAWFEISLSPNSWALCWDIVLT
jgi:hypothetical protein